MGGAHADANILFFFFFLGVLGVLGVLARTPCRCGSPRVPRLRESPAGVVGVEPLGSRRRELRGSRKGDKDAKNYGSLAEAQSTQRGTRIRNRQFHSGALQNIEPE
jgi:hypothetical protein